MKQYLIKDFPVKEFLATTSSKLLRSLLIPALMLLAAQTHAGVIVKFDPNSTQVIAGQSVTVDLLADIDEPDGVIGWGLDLEFDQSLLSLQNILIGSQWTPLTSDDNLGGFLPFAFPPAPVSGADTLLATLLFEAISEGTSDLFASATPLDLLEGFALSTPGAFAETEFQQGQVVVSAVSEPGVLLLLSIAFALLALRRV